MLLTKKRLSSCSIRACFTFLRSQVCNNGRLYLGIPAKAARLNVIGQGIYSYDVVARSQIPNEFGMTARRTMLLIVCLTKKPLQTGEASIVFCHTDEGSIFIP